jgi:hypothetical protein
VGEVRCICIRPLLEQEFNYGRLACGCGCQERSPAFYGLSIYVRASLHERLNQVEMSRRGRKSQRSAVMEVGWSGHRTAIEEYLGDFSVALTECPFESGVALFVVSVGICSADTEEFRNRCKAPDGGMDESRVSVHVTGVNRSASFQQQFSNFVVSCSGRLHKGRTAVGVPYVNSGSVFYEKPHHLQVPASARSDKGKGLAVGNVYVSACLMQVLK